MPYKEIQDKQMHYQDIGEGEVILLGHSYLWDSDMWQPQIEALSKNHRLIIPDLWGHGKSDIFKEQVYEGEKYPVSILAEDYIELMDSLNIKEFHIVGLSVGGMWGGQIAVDHPERVKSLTLIGTYLGEEPSELQNRYFTMIEMTQQIERFSDDMVEAITPLFFSPETIKSQPNLVAEFKERLINTPAEKIDTIAEVGRGIFSRNSILKEFSELEIPIQIIVGMDDMSRPAKESEKMADMLNHANLYVVSDAGHICNIEKPEKITSLLQNFLENLQNYKISA